MKKYLFWGLSAIIAFTSCVNTGLKDVKSKVSFTTKIETKVTDNAFNTNDAIYVEAYDATQAKVGSGIYTYSGGKFTSTSAIEKKADASLSYAAIYPSTYTTLNTEFVFTANTDQSTPEKFEMSDLLVSKADSTADSEPKLTFFHALTNLVLNIEGVDINQCVATFNLKNKVSINVATEEYLEDSSSPVSITPLKTSNGFKVIVAPQEVAAGTEIATISVNGTEYKWVITGMDAVNIMDGYQYSYTMAIDPVVGTSEVKFDGMIQGWGNGGTIGGSGNTTNPPTEGNTITITGGNGLTDQAAAGSFTVGEIGFAYADTYFNTQYKSYNIKKGGNGFIGNTTEIKGLTKIVARTNYQHYNNTLHVGTSADNCNTLITPTNSTVGEYTEYTYVVPEGNTFFKVTNATEYNASTNEFIIHKKEESTGGENPGDGGTEVPYTYEFSDFLTALGITTVPSAGHNITTVDFTELSLTSEKGTSSTSFRLWDDGTLRTYSGNTITFTAKNGKKITKVEFSNSTIESSANVGNVSEKTWTGDTNEVTLTMGKAVNTSIIVTIK